MPRLVLCLALGACSSGTIERTDDRSSTSRSTSTGAAPFASPTASSPSASATADQPDDCNDGFADIHPETADPWGDDTDSNCDGVDGHECSSEVEPERIAPLDPDCAEAPDIAISELRDCWSCCNGGIGAVSFFVGNRGGVDFTGDVVLRISPSARAPEDAERELLVSGLAAGATTDVVSIGDERVGSFGLSVELVDAAGQPTTDCDPYNQTAVLTFEPECGCM